MIIHNLPQTIGPGTLGLLFSAFLWVSTMFVVLTHRAGVQMIGGGIALLGLITLLVHNKIILSLSLVFFGLFIHWCGRLLLYLRRR